MVVAVAEILEVVETAVVAKAGVSEVLGPYQAGTAVPAVTVM